MLYNNFKAAKTAGDVGEAMVYKTLSASGYNVIDVSENKDYFDKDIDLIAENGNQHLDIEVKSDAKVSTTGNVVLETMTNLEWRKKGWFNTTQASHIFFVDIHSKIIHCVRLDELKEVYKKNESKIPKKITHQWECDMFYKEGEIALMPVSLLETTEHYVRLKAA